MLRRTSPAVAQKQLGFFERAVYWTPHPKKRHTGGEDAYVATERVLSVLDGISWWGEKYGISASQYSEHLARGMYEIYEDWKDDLSVDQDFAETLQEIATTTLLQGKPASAASASVALLDCAYTRTQATECSRVMAKTLAKESNNLASDNTERPPRDSLPPSMQAAGPASTTTVDGTTAIPNAAKLQQRAANDVFRENPQEVKKLMEKTGCLIGSTTALVATISADRHLDVASLGDCTLLHFRGIKYQYSSIHKKRLPTGYELKYESKSLVHGLSTPYQLGTGSRSVPADSLTDRIPVEDGDLVLLGSDGLFDNLHIEVIAQMFTKRVLQAHEGRLQKEAASFFSSLKYRLERAKKEDAQRVKEQSRTSTKVAVGGPAGAGPAATTTISNPSDATSVFFPLFSTPSQESCYSYHRDAMQQIVDASNSKEETTQLGLMVATMECVSEAMIMGADPRARTPFSDACAAHNVHHSGGKLDDVTVVAAVIGEDPFENGERVVTSAVARPPPYKNWPL